MQKYENSLNLKHVCNLYAPIASALSTLSTETTSTAVAHENYSAFESRIPSKANW